MKKNLRPPVLVFLAFLSVLSFFPGCSKRVEKTDTLVVWHWMVDRHDAFEALAKKYKELTGVTVQFKLYAPSDIYSQKVIAAAQAKILPDIYGILDKKAVMAKFINNGCVADLTEEFTKDNKAWEKELFPKALAANLFEEGNVYNVKPGIYGVPLDVMNIQLLYNKKLLQKAGIKNLPKNFDELIAMAKALKRVGISTLVSGWGELWLVDCFAMNYAFNIMGEDKVMATYRGDVPYTDPDWVKVFQVFETLAKNDALMVGIVTKPNKIAEQDFAMERSAFAFNGSWCVNVYNEMNPALDYGVMIPPRVSSRFPMKIWGGAGSSFVVSDYSPNKDKAVEFLKWLTERDQQVFLSEKTKNLPSNRRAISSIPPVLAEFASAMGNTTHPSVWPLNEGPVVKEVFSRGIQSIIVGEKTPQQVAEEVQKAKVRQLEKQKKRENR